MSARLSEILDDARTLHSATEAAQLSDISWLTNELDALDVPRDGVWRARIVILRNEVYQRVGDFQSEFENPPAKAGESEIGDFGRRLFRGDGGVAWRKRSAARSDRLPS